MYMIYIFIILFRYNATDLLDDLRKTPSNKFQNFYRMSATDFEYFIQKIGPIITKQDTTTRKASPVQERLAVTLRYLASGDSFMSLSYLFKFSTQTVSRCVSGLKPLKDEINPLTSTLFFIVIHPESK